MTRPEGRDRNRVIAASGNSRQRSIVDHIEAGVQKIKSDLPPLSDRSILPSLSADRPSE